MPEALKDQDRVYPQKPLIEPVAPDGERTIPRLNSYRCSLITTRTDAALSQIHSQLPPIAISTHAAEKDGEAMN